MLRVRHVLALESPTAGRINAQSLVEQKPQLPQRAAVRQLAGLLAFAAAEVPAWPVTFLLQPRVREFRLLPDRNLREIQHPDR